ncbi:MAG: helix-turn-helix protein [Microvirga sp.]|jgi:excisionase family DNA binding protein|nr:helix-turn-helix protein [Microvirga sp.]
MESQSALQIEEVAKRASIGRTKVFEEIRSGRLPARKLGRRTIVLTSDFDNWLNSLPRSKRP